jgi:glycerol-3-phosphate dehydrogenase
MMTERGNTRRQGAEPDFPVSIAQRAETSEHVYDLAVIGGGVNGCGIARDAAGRGASVVLFEQNDLASATSSASTKLVHGGLRYLEYYEFRLVREALMEREVMWRLAPHIVWPLRFVLPHHKGLRPWWLLRLGLLMYDNLGGRKLLPGTTIVNLETSPAGKPLKPLFTRAFEYSDCWVEDSRLVVLNARDAAEHGAEIAPRTELLRARRDGDVWRAELSGGRTVAAKAIVNAAGPWVGDVLSGVVRSNTRSSVRLVQGSHIVVRKLFDHDRCYIFQNADDRIIFAIPYERDFTLIGTTDNDYTGDPTAVKASEDEIEYLRAAASEYFRNPITRDDVVWTYSGVRPLFDDGASKAREATRDYVLTLDAPAGSAPLLSVFGGKITTYRRLAEAALEKLAPHLPAAARPSWTAGPPLPGGDFPPTGYDTLVSEVLTKRAWLGRPLAARLVRAYGTRVQALLGASASMADLGQVFGADLTQAEVDYLMSEEWAVAADDVLWRRSKLGLRFDAAQREALETYMLAQRRGVAGMVKQPARASGREGTAR